MSNPNSFHYHDVKANYIETKLEFLVPTLEEKRDDLNEEEFLKNYNLILLDYCKTRKLKQPYPVVIVVPSNDPDPFTYFAAFHIITCMIDEIDPFLDYQLRKYDLGQEDFIGLVEFFIINAIKTLTPRKSEEDRIAIVRNWVKHYRVGYPKPTINEVKIIEEKESKITMAPELINECSTKLKLYFSEEHLILFTKLLSGESIEDKIIFLGLAGVLVDVFTQIKDKGLIVETKTTINRWICKNLEYKKNGMNVSFDPDYVKRILTSQSTPSKKSRIIIDFS